MAGIPTEGIGEGVAVMPWDNVGAGLGRGFEGKSIDSVVLVLSTFVVCIPVYT